MISAINAHAILSVTDAAGNIIEINDKFSEISGYSRAELLGCNHRLLKSGKHNAAFYRAMWQTISAGRVWHGEICNRRKDGSHYWVESTITPVVDAGGKVQGYVSLRTDITRTKSNELILQQLAAISNHPDEQFIAAAVAWLAAALEVRLAFISVMDPLESGVFRPLAVWDRGSLQSGSVHPIAGTPCEVVLKEGHALYVTGVAGMFPAAKTPGGDSIDSYLGVRFRDSGGGLTGVIGVMDDRPLRDWREKQEWLSVLVPRIEHILQRAHYQRELQRQEAQYRTLTQNIPGMVFRAGADWTLEFLNGSMPICGFHESRFLHTRGNWIKLVHPEDRQGVLDETRVLEVGPLATVQQYRIMHCDGSLRWVSDHKRSLFDEVGRFVGVDGVLFDITARKQAELANAQDKERLMRSQRYANIGTWDWNIETSELYWTDRIPVLFGYPEGGLETTYDNFLAAVHPDDQHLVVEGVDRCIEQHIPYELEHRVVWPDGSVRWLLERGDVIRDSSGRPLHMLGVVQDIDDRKRAELALAEREAQLREAQALAHIGNWQADFRSGALFWSEEIYRIFGRESGTFVPTVARFHEAVHGDDLAQVIAAEERAGQTGILDVVHRIVRPNGDIRHVHELARADFDAGGALVVMIGTVQDVTPQVRSQQALIKAREEAERANRAKTEFLSSMSHELRTPMNAILGFSQLLEIDPALDRHQRESIGEIRKAGSHLLHLINEVLDLARIESGQFALATEPVVLSELVRECQALIRPLALAREIPVRAAITGDPVVMADQHRLKQVLLNLLSNAVKYNRQGGLVEISTRESGRGRVRILIRDTGVGIPVESCHRVFEAFTRLHEDQAGIEGTGIGLTITRKLVELMGGSIDFESSVGLGTCFHVELPLAQGWSRPVEQAMVSGRDNREAAATEPQHRTVLLVDDNPANLRLVARILERVPEAELLAACSGGLGLELARAHHPDLVLLDINMPDMDGYKLLELIRNDSAISTIPVVAITANALPSDIEKGLAAGFADYLTKPLEINQFIAQLRRLLRLRPQEALRPTADR